MKMAITVPLIGWVAKDGTSVGFPVSRFGAQKEHDPNRPEAGDGTRPDGKLVTPAPPTWSSVAAPPETIRGWIQRMRKLDTARPQKSVAMYILDNEPNLWSRTHRDIHPNPMSYDELLDRTLRYGAAIRQADPDAVIAGPAEWGWSGYFFSGKDQTGFVSGLRSQGARRRPVAPLVLGTPRQRREADRGSHSRRGRRAFLSAREGGVRQRRAHRSRDGRAAPAFDACPLGSDVRRRVLDQGADRAHSAP